MWETITCGRHYNDCVFVIVVTIVRVYVMGVVFLYCVLVTY